MNQTLAVLRKEFNNYIGSPMALIFVGVFLAANLFVFFWVDAFWARGSADMRSMFRWMPILLIFLIAALTMRQWSEEEQAGTLEVLFTLPVRLAQLVLGKFLGVMALVLVALALTMFLPLTVSLLGPLDWGPVWGGYLAAILLAGAYTAIGLFISSRTNNQIVALILTVLLIGLFYLVGARAVTDFVGGSLAEILRAIGLGSRFESIQRGVIDLRDLVYYLSFTALFLLFNVLSLDNKRWSSGENTAGYRRALLITALLIGLNLIAVNFWLYSFRLARVDLTENKEYTLSPATREILSNLQEPLLIRGYFSEKTHPLLAPLAPRMRDLLEEYRLASNGKVTVEIIDPLQDSAKEKEANDVYGIQPTPLQAADRYGASLVNAYFDILVRYGDQSQVLNFQNLIEVQSYRSGEVDVRMRNPEYDLTRAVKKVVSGFQSLDVALAALQEPVQLTLFVTPPTLPKPLQGVPDTIKKVAEKIQTDSNGKFSFSMVNPDDPNSSINRQTLVSQYNLQPYPASLFSNQNYYMHLVLQKGNQAQLLYPAGDLSEADIRATIEAALKRLSPGFLKVVGLWTPPQQPQQDMMGQQQPSFKRYDVIAEQLRQEYTVEPVDLSTGRVPANIDVLLVIAPQNMSDNERYAIDQYLMRGGAVVAAAGNYTFNPDPMTGGFGVTPVQNGLRDIFASYGIDIQQGMVMDPQSELTPLPVNGNQFIAAAYPFFVDVRPSGMDRQSPLLAGLPAVTLNWVSPVVVNSQPNAARQITTLLKSSQSSWLTTRPDINANPQLPDLGFSPEGGQASFPLAVAVQGVFDSYFKGKASPLAPSAAITDTPSAQDVSGAATIEKSPNSARLVVIGSAEFLNDIIFNLSRNLNRDNYLNSLRLTQNAIDWSVEDSDLLSIRSRGTSARLLNPLAVVNQRFWEIANYVLALAALIVLGVLWGMRRRNEQPLVLIPPEELPQRSRP